MVGFAGSTSFVGSFLAGSSGLLFPSGFMADPSFRAPLRLGFSSCSSIRDTTFRTAAFLLAGALSFPESSGAGSLADVERGGM